MIRDLFLTFGLGWWYGACAIALTGITIVAALERRRIRIHGDRAW